MAALDAPTEPRIARSRQRRCPAPPPRRASRRAIPTPAATVGAQLPRTVQRAAPQVAPTAALLPSSISADPEPRRSRRWIGVLVGALAAGMATGASLAVAGVGVLPSATPGPTATQALGAVQHLGPQQGGAQTIQKTFTVDQNSLLDLGSRVQYRAVGQVQATVDLGAVRASDIQIRGTRATVHIPPAQLGPPVIDDTSSGFVNNRGRLIVPDPLGGGDLTSADVQPQAEQQLSDAAQAQGLPDAAQQLAMARVRATLRRLGFSAVAVSTTGA